ncbi:putative ATP binding protein SugR [Yersinia intermedia]|uniref:AAA family ATPase n=1 Tax=Yersinia intermedia TaxID=631 RepID=UPI0005E7DAAF|nr:AAA family ATPase [Yersinia intermedia]CNB23608.1 putative ATP binding protein SugR [Yersinia intermedia]CNB46725.1 putative ATP binding protein SugR [Yersinia intermedia]CNF89076.1 putative ATP binding protein SugR [Yersinia intermedia]CRE46923.1 putative ATP binding protein SugR [Yersinia intermedia]
MKLKSLGLTAFRGFDRLDINFDERLTVVAGVNGVGKSTILQAIAMAYSHSLPEFTVSREKALPVLDADIQQGKSTCIIEMESSGLGAAQLITFLSKESLDKDEKLALGHKQAQMKKNLARLERGAPDYKNLKNEITWVDKRLEGNFEKRLRWLFTDTNETEARLKRHLKSSPTQALVVYYSTHRLLSRLPPKLQGTLPFKQGAAFSKSLTQLEISLNEFAKWQRAIFSTRVLRKETVQYGERILKLLQEAISSLMPQVKEFWFHEGNPPRYSVMKDATMAEQVNDKKAGKQLFLEQLSDGERGLIALVFDLTRRLAIANPNLKNPIAEGEALVLIDEIELHLHPKWQREVLQRLSDTFKACQFVVTTHSPLVLGEVPARCVRFLEIVDGKVSVAVPTEAYGMDANRILQELMGAPVRNREVEGTLNALFELIDQERFDDARAAIRALEQKLGEDEPELIRASSLIRFLEGDE